jgi:PAS domain S-box-containing protein
MNWVLAVNIGLSFVAVPITVAVCYAAWRRRSAPGILSFFLMMANCSVWVISDFLSTLGPTERVALAWQIPIRMAAVSLLPLFFLAFSLEYTGNSAWLRPRRFVWLTIVPIISQVLLWTPLHPQFIRTIEFARVGPFFLRQGATLGPWFPIHRTYSYALVVISLLLLFVQIFRSFHFYRRQAIILFLGMLLAVSANAIANLSIPQLGGTVAPWLDWTLASFTISGIAWSWALFRVRFLDVMPFALDAVFDGMNDAAIVLDSAGRIVDLNPAASWLVGRTRMEAVGIALPEVAKDIAAVVERPDLRGQRAEIAVGDRVLELRISPLDGPRGVVGRLAVLRDVTERVQLMRELDAYARTVAHDLKNPITVVAGYVEVILTSGAPLDQQTRGYLARIAETSNTMDRIINELLLLARVRSVRQVKTTHLDMAPIVASVVERFGSEIRRTGAEIVAPPAWPSARGYAAWVEEIWANYVSNALKYGGTPPRVEIGATETTDTVRFWVRDHGPGMSNEASTRVFKEFERLDNEHAEGHGLGLSIVTRIVRKLGGEAGVTSTLGDGCTFWFTLPRNRESVT